MATVKKPVKKRKVGRPRKPKEPISYKKLYETKGMPRTYKSGADLLENFIEYAEKCEEIGKFPNLAGFAVYMGTSRQNVWETKEYYPEAYAIIESALEDEALNTDILKGSQKIFYLKNKFKELYKDNFEYEMKGNPINIALDQEKLDWTK